MIPVIPAGISHCCRSTKRPSPFLGIRSKLEIASRAIHIASGETLGSRPPADPPFGFRRGWYHLFYKKKRKKRKRKERNDGSLESCERKRFRFPTETSSGVVAVPFSCAHRARPIRGLLYARMKSRDMEVTTSGNDKEPTGRNFRYAVIPNLE